MTNTDPSGAEQAPESPAETAVPLRPTRQRTAVTEALSGASDFRSAQQIHDLIASRGEKVGLATVYRTLAALAEAGTVDVLRTEDGEALYRRCEAVHHHHHLVCRECGATVEIEGPAVEKWAATVGREHGYTAINHELELFGTCPRCSS